MAHHLGLATRTQISVCKSPFPFAGTTEKRKRTTVQQRSLLLREVKTRLPDCGAAMGIAVITNLTLRPTLLTLTLKYALTVTLTVCYKIVYRLINIPFDAFFKFAGGRSTRGGSTEIVVS